MSQNGKNQSEIWPSSSHASDQPYCLDLSCQCHTSVEYHGQVTGIQQYSDEEISEALEFWNIFDTKYQAA